MCIGSFSPQLYTLKESRTTPNGPQTEYDQAPLLASPVTRFLAPLLSEIFHCTWGATLEMAAVQLLGKPYLQSPTQEPAPIQEQVAARRRGNQDVFSMHGCASLLLSIYYKWLWHRSNKSQGSGDGVPIETFLPLPSTQKMSRGWWTPAISWIRRARACHLKYWYPSQADILKKIAPSGSVRKTPKRKLLKQSSSFCP